MACPAGKRSMDRHTASNSAIDKGRAVLQVKLDFDRQARDGAYDLGADELAAAP